MPGLIGLAALSADVTATMPLNTPAVSTATTGALPVGATHRLDATGGALARTLPSAVSAGAGGIVVVKKTDATSNAVTVTASGSDTINVSGSTRTLTLPREAAHFRSDGVSDWTVVASDTPVTQLDARYDARYITPAAGIGVYAPLTLPKPGNLPARVPVTWISQLQTGHGFTAAGGALASSNGNDTTDYVFGTQAAKATTTGAGGSGSYWEKTGLSFTLTGKSLVVMLKVDDITHLKQVWVYVGDASYANSWRWQEVQVVPTTRPAHWASGEWAQITLSFSDAIVNAGSPTRSQTNTQIRVLVGDDAAGAVTWHLNGVGTIPEARTTFPNGVVSLTFDDSYGAHDSICRAYMDRYAYAGTLFPILDIIGAGSNLTTAQIQRMATYSGWEIGAHASTQAAHDTAPTAMTSAQRITEMQAMKAWLAGQGFASDTYAYPQGKYDAATVVDTRKAFACARTIYQESYETAPCADPFRIRAVNPTALTLAQAKALVDNAYTNGGWLAWVFHDINAGGTGANSWSTANFQGLVDYFNTKGIPVKTVGEVLRSPTP